MLYQVSFSQIVANNEMESFPSYLLVSDLERGLALASLLQKISTPEVKFDVIKVEPAKLNQL